VVAAGVLAALASLCTTVLVGVVWASLTPRPHQPWRLPPLPDAAPAARAALPDEAQPLSVSYEELLPENLGHQGSLRDTMSGPPTAAMAALSAAVRGGQPVPRAVLLEAALDMDVRRYVAGVLQSDAPADYARVRAQVAARLEALKTELKTQLRQSADTPSARLAHAKANLFAGKTMRYQRASASITEALLSGRLQCQSATMATLLTLWAAGAEGRTALVFTPGHVQPAVRDQSGVLHVVEATHRDTKVASKPLEKLRGYNAQVMDAELAVTAAIAYHLGVPKGSVIALLERAEWIEPEATRGSSAIGNRIRPSSTRSAVRAGLSFLTGAIDDPSRPEATEAAEQEVGEGADPLAWGRDQREQDEAWAAQQRKAATDHAAVMRQFVAHAIDDAAGNVHAGVDTDWGPLFVDEEDQDQVTVADFSGDAPLTMTQVPGPRERSRDERSPPASDPLLRVDPAALWHQVGLLRVSCKIYRPAVVVAVRTDVHRCRSAMGGNPAACERARRSLSRFQCRGPKGWRELLR
jgi:hypothetical protein